MPSADLMHEAGHPEMVLLDNQRDGVERWWGCDSGWEEHMIPVADSRCCKAKTITIL